MLQERIHMRAFLHINSMNMSLNLNGHNKIRIWNRLQSKLELRIFSEKYLKGAVNESFIKIQN